VTPDSSRPTDATSAVASPSVRATSRSVKIADTFAGIVVRSGGLLVIVAVVGILLFLVKTVWPLFRGAEVRETPIAGRVPVEGPPRVLAIDEYRLLAAAVGDAPEVVVFRADTTEVVARFAIPSLEQARVSTARLSVRSNDLVVGTTDGRLAMLRLSFSSDYVIGAEADALRARVPVGKTVTDGESVVERRQGGTLQRVRCVIEPRGTFHSPSLSGAIVAAGSSTLDDARVVAAVAADGSAHIIRGTSGGDGAGAEWREEAITVVGTTVPAGLVAAFVDEELRTAWFASRAGALMRVDLSTSPAAVREVRLTARGDGSKLTAVEPLIGDRSIVLADDRGRVSVWSPSPLDATRVGSDADPGDGRVIERLHEFELHGSPVTVAQACSTRRTVYLGHADGSVTVVYAVNERVLARINAFQGPVSAIAVGPRDDGILVAGPGSAFRGFDVSAPHPEVSFGYLFTPVHYEGYGKPQYLYQSSSSSDEAEPKLSLWPLVFGTLKATLYAMLFALPLSLLGALYTSQFMHPKIRSVVKPTVEVMASLPSVVLGFLAALVIAPAVADVVPGVFAAIFALFVVGFGVGCVWYLVPSDLRNGLGSGPRLLIAAMLVAATGWVCIATTPWVERQLFEVVTKDGAVVASFTRWMRVGKDAAHADGTVASGLPLLRLGLFVLGSTLGAMLLPRALAIPVRGGRAIAISVQTLVYAVVPGLVLALLAPLVERFLFGGNFRWFLVSTDDPSHGVVFDIRNSLVVGIAMGFAVIPIIYTIAEDALSAIPQTLRSAALGCGASPWQAATRVILPAAIPGIFSAVMIGIGRAIGETMIVLMAAGGTPILDWSIFNGLRSLSANIATEMAEAPADSTLFRVLFLSGLILFALTFILNTLAEMVRIRFRKKFKGL
jgi:phosphate transport system permease protein